MSSNAEYKLYHEAFMQNHNGTTALDTFITILPNFFTSCITKYLIAYLSIYNNFYKMLIEFFIIVVPLIIGTTILSNYRIHILLFFVTLFVILHTRSFNLQEIWYLKIDRRRKWECISYVRALIGLTTGYCILAVDFNIFPRYLAKTESNGYSLMDLGVGLFVFSNALVPSKISRHSLFKSIELNFKQCFILLVLGLTRLVLIKETDYHEHITEYGVHWNFFITLAITKLVSTSILCMVKEGNSLTCGIILALFHEINLHRFLSEWVFSNAGRDTLMSANREGISSCLGYIALYLISTFIGQTIRDKIKEDTEGSVITTLLSFTITSWIVVYISINYLNVSRCLANAGYCSFVLAVGTSILLLFYIFELNEIFIQNKGKFNKEKKTINMLPVIYSAINNNGLIFFLISNVITGLVNLSFHTLHLEQLPSLLIIFSYMIFITFFIVGFNIKYKNNK